MKYATIGFLLALTMTASAVLSGCNTIEGAGQDMQKAGQGVENAADDENDD